jgi:TPP-dependent 2-oxoacid decarboxylase
VVTNRTISLTNEINEKLKKEENASLLITRLLTEHYKNSAPDTIEAVEEKLKSVEDKRKEYLDSIEKEETSLINKKELIKQKTEFIEKSKEEIVIKEIERLENIKKSFFEFLGRDITNEEMDDYLRRIDTEPGFNMYVFIDEKESKPEEEADKVLKS